MEETVFERIQETLKRLNEPSFRMKQVREAWYQPIQGWEDVTTLSKGLREVLSQEVPWFSIRRADVFTSQEDGTKKAIITLHDDAQVETVLMPNAKGGYTTCLSSQIGCAMACTFCATGKMGFARNLTSDEIVDQVRYWRSKLAAEGTDPSKLTNIVMMGMGEPLANYNNVKTALAIFLDEMGFAETNVVLSTVAFAKSLDKMLNDASFPDVRLAISIHAGTDTTRNKIVPSHTGTSIEQIEAFVRRYLKERGTRNKHITFEYVMLERVNDFEEEALSLANRYKDVRDQIKINLIPWNTTSGALERSSMDRIKAFKKILRSEGFDVTIRISKGQDIEAACGQLANTPADERPTEASA
ncbi:MAG: 23S rRNA (adenine(2503)-C(2))-methyltransferase RlmN [Candidatus Doudnabacteria bacterium]|nr:23S rRNA (adenine(2503)-C(2))-methyltransferase RlmN [Candidatus Doudnabacteria bacterium]